MTLFILADVLGNAALRSNVEPNLNLVRRILRCTHSTERVPTECFFRYSKVFRAVVSGSSVSSRGASIRMHAAEFPTSAVALG